MQDHHIASLSGEEQLWVKEGWYTKFNQTPNARDTGYHHTSEDVSGFKSPDVETQLAYHRAVLEQTKRYINTLSTSDLDRDVSEPWFQSLPTVGGGLICVLDDNLQHAGQVAYLRGLLKGKGWYEI